MDDATPPSIPVHEDLAALRGQVASLHAAQDVAAQIVATVRDPLLVLTPALRVQMANPAFYQLFQVTPAETEGQHLYQLGNGQWNLGQYVIARGSDLPLHDLEIEVLPALTADEAPKGMAEVNMIPVVPALLNAIFDVTGRRFRSLPVAQSVLTFPVQVVSPSVKVICACDPDCDPIAVT